MTFYGDLIADADEYPEQLVSVERREDRALVVLDDPAKLNVLSAALVAAIAVYMGIEAIVAVQSKRVGAALIAGAILGCAFWSALQSDLQFAGTHALTASFGYLAGAIASQLLALALALGMSRLLLRLSLAPRAMIIIAAAVVIHVSWRTMLDQDANERFALRIRIFDRGGDRQFENLARNSLSMFLFSRSLGPLQSL